MAKRPYVPNIIMEDVTLIHKNFAGKKTDYNRAGDRNFGVIIKDQEDALELKEKGLNIKEIPPREEGDDPTYWLPVTVRYHEDNPDYDPDIYLNTSKRQLRLGPATVSRLDSARATSIDLEIHPSYYEVQGRTGFKAYLKRLYFNLKEDSLSTKYDGMYDANGNRVTGLSANERRDDEDEDDYEY